MWRIDWTDSAIAMIWHTKRRNPNLRLNFRRDPLAAAIEAALNPKLNGVDFATWERIKQRSIDPPVIKVSSP